MPEIIEIVEPSPQSQPPGPPPGGGSWRWDAQAAAWVSLDEPAAPVSDTKE